MRPEDRNRFPAQKTTLKDGSLAILRFLQQDDGEHLAALYAALPQQARRHYWPHPLDREHALKNAAKADAPHDVVLVLETPAGDIGGYAWYRWRTADADRSVFGIAVRPDYQSRGAGRALMTRLLEVADTVGPAIICLTCQHANDRAVKLYQKMGFRIVREGICPERRGFPAEPQYWMERNRDELP